MVGLTAGTLSGSASHVRSPPANTDCPTSTANVVRFLLVFPPAVNVCVCCSAAVGRTRRPLPLLKSASSATDSPGQ